MIKGFIGKNKSAPNTVFIDFSDAWNLCVGLNVYILDFDADSKGTPLLTDHEINTLKPIFQTHGGDKDFYQVFLDLLKVNSWFSDEKLVKELEKPLMRLCAQYLYIVKRRGYALDPVGKLHQALRSNLVIMRFFWKYLYINLSCCLFF